MCFHVFDKPTSGILSLKTDDQINYIVIAFASKWWPSARNLIFPFIRTVIKLMKPGLDRDISQLKFLSFIFMSNYKISNDVLS